MRQSGAFHFFRWRGIDVDIHWSWLFLVAYEVQTLDHYSSRVYSLIETLAIFAMVLMHEFGHALACRSVGGQANYIILWPLGGISYVAPPNRPGAVLWSITAGPLVNVVLFPILLWAAITMGAQPGASPHGLPDHDFLGLLWIDRHATDLQLLACWLVIIDAVLLIFNLLPIYPLDGGQILRALLWFIIGPSWSLRLVAGFGLVASVLGGLWAIAVQAWLLAGIAAFAAWRSIVGLRVAQQMISPPKT